MIIEISSDALIDLEEGFDFYQRQSQGLGAYFISCLTSDILIRRKAPQAVFRARLVRMYQA
jgi:hypothetical protein